MTIESIKQWLFPFTLKPGSKVGDQPEISCLIMIGFPLGYDSLTEQVKARR